MVSTVSAALGLGAASAYLAGTYVQVRSISDTTKTRTPWLIALATFGAILQSACNYLLIVTPEGLNLGIATSASLVSWIMLAFVLIANLSLPVVNLLFVVLPVCAASVIAALLWSGPLAANIPTDTLSAPLLAHMLLSFVAYSILFMAACQSVLVAVLDRRLRARQTMGLVRMLPPLQTMEALLFNLLWAGIAVLTLAIASGFLFLDDMFAQRVVHHTVLAIASWCVYAALLAGRQVFGWRGSTAVRWTLIAFLLLVLGYFGSKFVIEILLEH